MKLKTEVVNCKVALRTEGVDRNRMVPNPFKQKVVALRTEGVDRNIANIEIKKLA